MQKSILASAILLSLTACDSASKNAVTGDETVIAPTEVATTIAADGDVATVNDTDTVVVTQEPVSDNTDTDVVVVADDDKYEDDEVVVVVNDDDKGDDKPDVTVVADNGATDDVQVISDDAGSSTSDNGQSTSDTDNSTSTDNQTISDDAGSATSDGGISDDAGSATSDGGISDDAGSATSDGGISDDAGSATSDGGIPDDAASGSSDGGTTVVSDQGDRDTDAGSFSSGVDGDVIRVSSLSSNSTENVCTTLSNQNNFSNINNVGDFILHNNAWRPFRAISGHEWEQCIYTNTNGAVAGWNYDWGNGQTGINGASSASGDFYVRSYPELIFGTKDEFRTSAPQSVTGLPVMLSEMPNFRIDYSYDGPQYGESRTVDASNNSRFPNGTTISGERNVAIESFFYETDTSGNCSSDTVRRGGGSNHTYEVMVWLDAGAERLPAGPNDFVANLNIRGADYKVYTKGSDERYIAFVAQNPQTTGTIYWNDFTDWARENAHQVRERFGAQSNSVQIQDDWCMANILVGTEIFWGAGNFDIYDWTITQSR